MTTSLNAAVEAICTMISGLDQTSQKRAELGGRYGTGDNVLPKDSL